MRSIIETAEADVAFEENFFHGPRLDTHDISSSISVASVKTAYGAGAKAIFAFTSSGSTARIISRFRPEMPIIALTNKEKTYHQLAFNWGVIPVEPQKAETSQQALAITSAFAQKRNLVQFGDLVIVTAGSPFGVSGTTNVMFVESIGEVLVRGDTTEGEEVSGQVRIVLTPDEYSEKASKGKIVVLSQFNEDYIPIAKKAKAVILQNHPEDEESEIEALQYAKEHKIPVLVRADEALRRLSNDQLVTLNPAKGTVYKKTPS